jgi:hypothetical protein
MSLFALSTTRLGVKTCHLQWIIDWLDKKQLLSADADADADADTSP